MSTLKLNTITCIATMSTCGRCGERWAAVSLMPGRMRAPGSTSVSHAAPRSAHVEWMRTGGCAGCLGSHTREHHAARNYDPHRRVQRPWEDSDYHHWHRCERARVRTPAYVSRRWTSLIETVRCKSTRVEIVVKGSWHCLMAVTPRIAERHLVVACIAAITTK